MFECYMTSHCSRDLVPMMPKSSKLWLLKHNALNKIFLGSLHFHSSVMVYSMDLGPMYK